MIDRLIRWCVIGCAWSVVTSGLFIVVAIALSFFPRFSDLQLAATMTATLIVIPLGGVCVLFLLVLFGVAAVVERKP